MKTSARLWGHSDDSWPAVASDRTCRICTASGLFVLVFFLTMYIIAASAIKSESLLLLAEFFWHSCNLHKVLLRQTQNENTHH